MRLAILFATFCAAFVPASGQVTPITLPNGAAGNRFGAAIKASETALLISAPGQSSEDSKSLGRVFCYHSTQDKSPSIIEDPESKPGDSFGCSLSIDGDWLFVGAMRTDYEDVEDSGAVVVFKRDHASWNLVQRLSPEKPIIGGVFGKSLLFDGKQLFVGYNGRERSLEGEVEIFELSTEGLWQRSQALRPDDLARADYFGSHLCRHENELFVGVPTDKSQSWQNGRVRCFTRNDGTWAATNSIFPTRDTAGNRFGVSIARVGDWLAVGESGFGTGSRDTQRWGAVSLYQKNDLGEWRYQKRIENPIKGLGGFFGQELLAYQGSLIVLATNQQEKKDDPRKCSVYRLDPNTEKLTLIGCAPRHGSSKQLSAACAIFANQLVFQTTDESNQVFTIPLD